MKSLSWIAAWIAVGICSCAVESAEPLSVSVIERALEPITNEQALVDFDQIVNEIDARYGPIERKQMRYGFSFEGLVREYRERVARASSEPEYIGLFKEFLAQLEDAHVTLPGFAQAAGSNAFFLPFLVTPVADSFVVSAASDEVPLSRGDELIAIDGEPVAAAVERLSFYDGVPNPLAAKHFGASYLTYRPPFLAGALTDGALAQLSIRRVDGSTLELTLRWIEDYDPLETVSVPAPGEGLGSQIAHSVAAQRVIQSELAYYGAALPFWLTREVVDELRPSEPIVPSETALARFSVRPEIAARIDYLAFKFDYCGKAILVLRVPDYVPNVELIEDEVGYLRALFFEQAPHVDGLIVDQTHNPGGSVELVSALAGLLAPRTIHGPVQANRADRAWIEQYLLAARTIRAASSEPNPPLALDMEAYARVIDQALGSNASLAAPTPLPFGQPTIEADPFHWNKPFLVLADELSVSGADMLPLLVKANALAPIFGSRTMGAGGTVESVGRLTNLGTTLSLTRGLFTVYDPSGIYPEQNYAEDVGVEPDIAYAHTLADFRAGYVAYVRAFSDALLESIQHRHESTEHRNDGED